MTLVEREPHLRVLSDIYDLSRSGTACAAMVSGPIGSGKSALLDRAARTFAEAGAVRLDALCSARERRTPFGAVDQLFATRYADAECTAEHSDHARRTVLTTIRRLASEKPLLIALDDAHHADESSLECLLFAARRLVDSRVLFLFTTRTEAGQADHESLSEFTYLPRTTHLPVAPVSPAGVAAFLREEAYAAVTPQLAADCHALTGGSPVLLRALVQDYFWQRAAGRVDPGRLVPGREFAHAVRQGVDRSGPATREVARATAVLGHAGEPDLLREIVGLSPVSTNAAVASLHGLGLLDQGRFRHDRIRDAVLEGIPPEARCRLHTRTAEVLHVHGAPAGHVTKHLMVSGETDRPWIVPTLTEAASHAMARGDGNAAVRVLHRALEASSDDERATTTALLAEAEWQLDPATASRHLPELTAAASEGRLTRAHTGTPVHLLLWQGRAAAAARVLGELDGRGTSPALNQLLACVYPNRFAVGEEPGPPSVEAAADVRAVATLRRLFVGGPDDALAAEAEQILESVHAGASDLIPTVAALTVLVCSEQAERAARWFEGWPAAEERGTPMQRALRTASRAMISLRIGDGTAAREQAQRALSMIPARSWGIGIGFPLACLLEAVTAAGEHREAAALLRHPVPDSMFETPIGVLYLNARGNHYSAVGRHESALADFTNCGDQLGRWGFDRAGLAPWRIGAARAHVALGQPDAARALLTDELRGLSPGRRSTRTTVHRLLSSLGVPATRRSAPTTDPTSGAGTADDGSVESRISQLSKSELRVVDLVTQGRTNREIAGALFITVSTVEQHLTRVYRKLNVHRRADLKTALRFSA